MSKPKRHHFVPRAYIQRFSHEGRVLVRWRGRPGLIEVGAQNIAVECGFYDVEGPGGERSVVVEQMLAELDGAAIAAMRSIDETEAPPEAGTTERFTLASFLAQQMTRTPEQRGRVLFPIDLAAYAGEREINATLVAEYLERVHLGFRPSDNEVRAALGYVHVALQEPGRPTKELAIRLMVEAADRLAPILLSWHWTLEIARKPRLNTSDTPLVMWRKPSILDRFEGVGIGNAGIGNAEEVRFPLDPRKQLVLTQTAKPPVHTINPDRVRACNTDMADRCHRFIVGNPRWPRSLEAVTLASKRPVVRFSTGPMYVRGPDGGMIRTEKEVLHMWVPRR